MDGPFDPVPEVVQSIKTWHESLARKYQLHGRKTEHLWTNFDKNQRSEAFRAGLPQDGYLKHSRDTDLGYVYKIVPDYNFEDIVDGEPDIFLDMLRFRATKSLQQQYAKGVHGGAGDYKVIRDRMRNFNLRHATNFGLHAFTLFLDEEISALSYRSPSAKRHRSLMNSRMRVPAVPARLFVPQEVGELILMRQYHMLTRLNILIQDILNIGSTTRTLKARPKKPDEAAVSALAKLSIVLQPQPTLIDIVAASREQKVSSNEYLECCYVEPVVPTHAVNRWFFLRPELIAEERFQIRPMLAEKYISIALFERTRDFAAGAATWDYLHRLLEILEGNPQDKISKAILLQEIYNVCHMEYARLQ